MPDLDSLFRERSIAKAALLLASLERYAAKREMFLAALDLAELSREEADRIADDDDLLFEALAFGHFYLTHLADLEAHAPAIRLAA